MKKLFFIAVFFTCIAASLSLWHFADVYFQPPTECTPFYAKQDTIVCLQYLDPLAGPQPVASPMVFTTMEEWFAANDGITADTIVGHGTCETFYPQDPGRSHQIIVITDERVVYNDRIWLR